MILQRFIIAVPLLLMLTACQWTQKRAIKNVLYEFYASPVCLDWHNLNDDAMMVLKQHNIITEKQSREPAGLMGYALTPSYQLTSTAKTNGDDALCYGRYQIDEIKAIEFENATQATASFVVTMMIDEQWARDEKFTSLIDAGKQLRRAHVVKNDDGVWEIIDPR